MTAFFEFVLGTFRFSGKDKAYVDIFWQNLLLAMIGETLDDQDEICGLVFQRRKAGDRLCIWTRNANNERAVMNIGSRMKTALVSGEEASIQSTAQTLQLQYDAHQTSIQTGYSYNTNQKYTLHSII
jgi:translation initiation factor 4E